MELVDKANTAYKSLKLAGLDAYLGINVHSHKIFNVLTPTSDYDAATKKYVDDNVGVTDHGALTGLADDDHTQYLLINGTREMTGNLTLGTGHGLYFVSPSYISGTSTYMSFYPAGTTALRLYATSVTAYQNTKPSGDNTLKLGLSDKRWSELHAFLGHFYGILDMHSHKITNVLTPTSDYDAATKKYVDDNVGVTDHGALTGLADDDHTQYLLINGTREMTGNLTLGTGHGLYFVSPSYISGTSTYMSFYPAGTTALRLYATSVTAYQNTKPSGDNTLKLGLSDKRWSELHAFLGHFYGILDMHSHKITNVLTPTSDYDAATKKYVDDNVGVTDHGALTGLADYDHDQYLRKNGAQSMTGNLNMGSSYIRADTTLTLRYQTLYRLALGSTSIICYEDFIPTSDNGFTLGLGALRWSDLYATVVHEGDVAFAEKECIKCNKKFKVGDNIVYKVIRFDKETEEPMAIPIHLECANSPPKKVKKSYAVEEDYYVWNEEKGEVVKRKRNKMVTKKVKKRKIKEGNFELDDKTGEFWRLKKGKEEKASIDEATEEIEEDLQEVVYKEEEFTI